MKTYFIALNLIIILVSSESSILLNDENTTVSIPLGIIYDATIGNDTRNLIDLTIDHINEQFKHFKIKWILHKLELKSLGDNSNEIVQHICKYISLGTLGVFGSITSKTHNAIKTFSNLYNLPYISWSNFIHTYSSQNKQDTQSASFQLYMQPDLMPMMISLIKYYKWSNIYYLYSSENGLNRLECLIEYQQNTNEHQIIARKILSEQNFKDILNGILHSKSNSTHLPINIIIDLADFDNGVQEAYLNELDDYLLMRFTFFVVSLNINELRLSKNNLQILGFSLVDYTSIQVLKRIQEILQLSNRATIYLNDYLISYKASLIIDGLYLLIKQAYSLVYDNPLKLDPDILLKSNLMYSNEGKNCSFHASNSLSLPPWSIGKLLLNKLRDNSLEHEQGLTGALFFNLMNGKRTNYTINIYKKMPNTPLTKVGLYHNNELKILNEQLFRIKTLSTSNSTLSATSALKRKLIITTIEDEPFLMKKQNYGDEMVDENDRYEGYCVDLAKRIAEIVNFTYELRLVKDGQYGSLVNEKTSEWNGMIGELLRGEADMSIAPLTISAIRESVVEFSKPFMDIGISIMILKSKDTPGLLSFMKPFSTHIYVCIILAYIAVTVILFLVSRFSPYEWNVTKCDSTEVKINNSFTISNTFWFCLSAFMQQGIDILPKSLSGRLVTSVWWFFTLILVSSYTANLAAFLTVAKMGTTIESADDLAKQTDIKYGTVDNGSTKEFFRTSKVLTYGRMWSFMSNQVPSVFVKNNQEGIERVRAANGKYAFLLESSKNEYLNEREPCDTIKVGSNLDSKGYGIAVPLGSEIIDQINLAVLQLLEAGELERLKMKWWSDKGQCGSGAGLTSDTSKKTQSQSKDSSQNNALKFENFKGMFLILVIGLLLSILFVLLELVYKTKKESIKLQIHFMDALKIELIKSINGYNQCTRISRENSSNAIIRKNANAESFEEKKQVMARDDDDFFKIEDTQKSQTLV